MSKPWEQRPAGRRPASTRDRRRVLIVCEDSKSSCYYFESFKQVVHQRAELVALGAGMNTDSLVEHAMACFNKAARDGKPYNNVWCVFDRDSFPLEKYHRAFELARANGFRVAWANEAFELWYLLHFNYLDAAISRQDYKSKLAQCGLDYDKADETIYAKVENRQATAMKHARKLERYWNDRGERFPERQNPSTGVHKLVDFLNDLADLGSAD